MQPATISHQIRFVTTNYERLQGLRLVPAGITMLVVGLTLAVWPSSPSFGIFAALVIPAALITEAGRRWADHYYTRTFGTVRGTSPLPKAELFLFDRGTTMSSRLLPGLAVGVLAGVLTILHVPAYVIVCLGVVLWAIGLALYLRRVGQLAPRMYWVAGAAILSVIGVILALPLAALASLHSDTEVFRFLGLMLAPYGLVMLACSILDHRLLVHSFALTARTHHAATV